MSSWPFPAARLEACRCEKRPSFQESEVGDLVSVFGGQKIFGFFSMPPSIRPTWRLLSNSSECLWGLSCPQSFAKHNQVSVSLFSASASVSLETK